LALARLERSQTLKLYDALTASGLDDGQRFLSLAPFNNAEANGGGSIDLHLGPTAPPGKENLDWTLPRRDRQLSSDE
jgi:hypothetical protein